MTLGEDMLTENRILKIRNLVSKRQFDFTVIIENVHDPHNISAVLRTCDAVGIQEVYVILNDDRVDKQHYEINNTISKGSSKWVKVHMFESPAQCITEVRKKYSKIFGTHLGENSVSLYDLDFTESVALAFGNEHDGISDQLLSLLDGNFIIPQYGMTQSLNISVACAVSLYEGLRQKEVLGHYNDGQLWSTDQTDLYEHYIEVNTNKILRKI